MIAKHSLHKILTVHFIMLISCALLVGSIIFSLPFVKASSPINISVETNYDSYYYMQSVGVYANLTLNGTPIKDGLVALEVNRPTLEGTGEWAPIIFRTLKGSQPPNPSLLDGTLEILSIKPIDANWQPKTIFKRGETCYLNVTIRNTGLGKYGLITASIFDSLWTPIGAQAFGAPGFPYFISPSTFGVRVEFRIPTWAGIGTATVFINIFKDSPSFYGGYPICEEKSATFQIRSSYGPLMTIQDYPTPPNALTNTKGIYNFTWRIPPRPYTGNYKVYVAANYTNATPNSALTIFQVASASMPPQASFTYLPTNPYAGGTTYFDASASFSYNGTITNYKWTWGDGSPSSETSSPFITHVFNNEGTYLVTLNVTDSQGLWCTTQKPIYVSGPTPPTASFTFIPNPTWISMNTKFDASSSTPGWNGTGYPPIIEYTWNFGDGTPDVIESDPITYHQFTELGNFNVTLTVKDTRGWTDSFSSIVEVIEVTEHPDIAVVNVAFPSPPNGPYEISHDYYEPYKGWSGDIKVEVKNNGTTTVSFSVTLYYDNGTSYLIGTRSVVNLPPSVEPILLTFSWDTSAIKPTMNYTITANATILIGETDITNNYYTITVRVKGPGDINGDGIVNINDATLVGLNWQQPVPPADPRVDTNLDGIISILDASIVGLNWMSTYPPP